MKVVFLDIDGTLCDSSHADHLLPGDEARGKRADDPVWNAWQSAMLANPGVPIPHGIERAANLVRNDTIVVFLTARSTGLEPVTREWLREHCRSIYDGAPCLYDFRPLEDGRSNLLSKTKRLIHHLYRFEHDADFHLLDDDEKLGAVAKSLGVTFHHATK